MKRRIFALMLALVMLCPMILTGCKSKTADDTNDTLNQTATRETVTITMWIVTDEKTTEEAKGKVEEEFNRITQAAFTTKVDLIFVTPDQYVSTLEAKMAQAAEAKKAASANKGNKTTTATGEVSEELVTNEYGVSVLKYPEVTDDQIDIVFVQGYDHLASLVKNKELLSLNDYIIETGKAKILTDVIPNVLFTYSKMNGDTYGIPNNRIVGEYTYLLVNKDVVTGDKNGDGTVTSDEVSSSYYNFSDIKSFFDCEKVIEYVKHNTDLVPVLEQFDNPYVHFWGNDSEFSLLSSPINDFSGQSTSSNVYYNMVNIFRNPNFVNFEKMMMKYKNDGYLATDVEATKKAQNFGVAVMKGDTTIIDQYSDNYYVKVISAPTLTEENLFTSFFGVSQYTKNKDRAVEVITMLNTDSELRNVLQYGVEGVHYEINDDGRVERFNNDYIMNIFDTGNIFIAHPEEYMPDDVWERGHEINLNLRVDPMIGFSSKMSTIDPTILENLAAQSKIYKDKLDACKTLEELEQFFESSLSDFNDKVPDGENMVDNESDAYKAFKAAIDDSNNKSVYSVYTKWFTDSKWVIPG